MAGKADNQRFAEDKSGDCTCCYFGITESVHVQRKPVITFFRKRGPVMTAEIAAFVHMAGIPLALGTAC